MSSSNIRKALKNPSKILPNIVMKTAICNSMSDENYIKLVYFLRFWRMPDLKKPVLFSEKMQWLKIHDRKEEYIQMVDKISSKVYAAGVIGSEYIIPTLAVGDSLADIDFEQLPDQFVVKTSHDSGGVYICKDKAALDYAAMTAKINHSLRNNYYYSSREWNYKHVKPRVLVEEYLENESCDGLHDYKVWCFGGKARYIQYITGRGGAVTREAFYDCEWNKLPFTFHNPQMQEDVPRPKQLDRLLMLAEKLAKDLRFGRIDFYVLPDDSLRFGEITFFPMGGFETWNPREMDLEIGNLIVL